MLFSELKQAFEIQCNDKSCRVENKQRLNLSPNAYKVLLQDMDIGGAVTRRAGTGKPNSEIINRIFINYCDRARSSIARRLKEYEAALRRQLQELPNCDNKVIRYLVSLEEQTLLQERDRRCETKGYPLYFRLNVDAMSILASAPDAREYLDGQAEKCYYGDNVGLYIKAVLEEYAGLPFSQREQICNKPIIEAIEEATESHRMMKLVLPGTVPSGKYSKRNQLYIKPYRLCTDQEHLYNYVIGLTCQRRDGQFVPGAVRISSICDYTVTKEAAFLSSAAKKDLNNRLQRNDAPYVSESEAAQRIVVQLTTQGEKLYRRMLHLRPERVETLQPHVYVFHCSNWQAMNYFFKFGQDAKILEPEKLARSFQRRYLEAAKQYEELK